FSKIFLVKTLPKNIIGCEFTKSEIRSCLALFTLIRFERLKDPKLNPRVCTTLVIKCLNKIHIRSSSCEPNK
uniref:Uncharacterized protein n=1 Tax=Oryzias melastigma TaxID=30732 RepID=A0A3B3CFX1_ORYME